MRVRWCGGGGSGGVGGRVEFYIEVSSGTTPDEALKSKTYLEDSETN